MLILREVKKRIKNKTVSSFCVAYFVSLLLELFFLYAVSILYMFWHSVKEAVEILLQNVPNDVCVIDLQQKLLKSVIDFFVIILI